MTTHVRLEGDGPFVLPIAEGCLGLGISGGQLPIQIQLVLLHGLELHLPIEEPALHRLYDVLKGHFEKQP